MKNYTKPSLEVISMKTSENIADNLIKTMYTKASVGSDYGYVGSAAAYDAMIDMTGSNPA